MCPESIPRIWLHPPAVAVGNTFQIGNHLPVSRLCSLGGCLLSFFPLAPVPPFHLFLFFCSSVFCPFSPLLLFPFPPVFVLLFFCYPFPFPFFCSFVLLSSFPFSFFSVLLSFCLPFRLSFFCSFVLLSSVLLSFCLPFPPALYNIIRWSPRRRAFGAIDSCQER